MKPRYGYSVMIGVGILLVLGPLWGALGTLFGMIRTFSAATNASAQDPAQLASSVSLSLWSTAAGLLVAPVGVILIVWGSLRLGRARYHDDAST